MKTPLQTYSFRWAADIDKAILEENGIECRLEDYNTDIQLNQAIGGIKLFVDREFFEQAKIIIVTAKIQREKDEIPDNIQKGIPVCPHCGCKAFSSKKIPVLLFYALGLFIALMVDVHFSNYFARTLWLAGLVYLIVRKWEARCIRCSSVLKSPE